MRLTLLALMLGKDEPAVAKAVAVIRTLHETRKAFVKHGLTVVAVAACVANLLAAAVIFGGGQ